MTYCRWLVFGLPKLKNSMLPKLRMPSVTCQARILPGPAFRGRVGIPSLLAESSRCRVASSSRPTGPSSGDGADRHGSVTRPRLSGLNPLMGCPGYWTPTIQIYHIMDATRKNGPYRIRHLEICIAIILFRDSRSLSALLSLSSLSN
jgi:hypothetical protein